LRSEFFSFTPVISFSFDYYLLTPSSQHYPSLMQALTYISHHLKRAVREATEKALDHAEGWSSEGSDGGERITPEAAAAKKAAAGANKTANKRPKDVNALWRNGSTSTGTGTSGGGPRVYYSGTAMLGGVVERVGNLSLGGGAGTGDGSAATGGAAIDGSGASTGGWKEDGGKGRKGGNRWGAQENPPQWEDTNGW
jgi:hypothetical protein